MLATGFVFGWWCSEPKFPAASPRASQRVFLGVVNWLCCFLILQPSLWSSESTHQLSPMKVVSDDYLKGKSPMRKHRALERWPTMIRVLIEVDRITVAVLVSLLLIINHWR
jgi:hypothetical protein